MRGRKRSAPRLSRLLGRARGRCRGTARLAHPVCASVVFSVVRAASQQAPVSGDLRRQAGCCCFAKLKALTHPQRRHGAPVHGGVRVKLPPNSPTARGQTQIAQEHAQALDSNITHPQRRHRAPVHSSMCKEAALLISLRQQAQISYVAPPQEGPQILCHLKPVLRQRALAAVG